MCRPEEAALIWAAIEQATKELFAARRADERAASNAEPGSADVSAETCAGTASDGPCEASVRISVEMTEGGSSEAACDWFMDVSAETCPGVASDGPGDSSVRTQCADSVHEHEVHSDVESDGTSASFEGAEGFEGADELDADDVYEDDCAFFEKFGVCPEPQPEPRLGVREEHDAPMPAVKSPTSTAIPSVMTPRSTVISESSGKPAQVQFNRLDGLLALMRKVATGEGLKTPVEIVVTVSAEALANRAAPNEYIAFLDDDGCISAETARRMSCDAGIVCMVEDEHGNPLSVGRRTRSIPASIGRALRKRDKCCRFPGCTNSVFLDGHHLEHWALGGATALTNLVRLCTRHHAFVHEYGYRVEMDTSGQPVFFDPQGRPAKDVPMRILRDDLGWEHILGANQGLGIEPHACGWSGERVEYDEVCRALYCVDAGLLKPEDIC